MNELIKKYKRNLEENLNSDLILDLDKSSSKYETIFFCKNKTFFFDYSNLERIELSNGLIYFKIKTTGISGKKEYGLLMENDSFFSKNVLLRMLKSKESFKEMNFNYYTKDGVLIVLRNCKKTGLVEYEKKYYFN